MAHSSGHGRGRGRAFNPTPGSPMRPGYRPAGYRHSSSDDDDLEMFGRSVQTKPLGLPSKLLPGEGSPGKSGRRPVTAGAGATSSPIAQGHYFFSPTPPKSETEGWGTGIRSSISTAIAGSSSTYTGSHAQSFTAPAGAGSSKYVGAKTALRNSLPTIPDVNHPRAIAAVKTLNTTWNNGIRDIFVSGIAKTLRSEFREAKNPYMMALYLMAHSMDYFTPKTNTNTLPQEIIKEFKAWVKEFGGPSLERQYLRPDSQLVAFNVICKQNIPNLMKLVFEIFRMDLIKNDLVAHIKKLCTEGKYKPACYAATYLGLFTQFEIHDFLVPLLLQDRESVASDYIQGSEASQGALIDFLDGVLGESSPSFTLRQYIQDNRIEQVKHEKMEIKPLTKLVGRLTQRFKMNVLDCPNVGKKKKLGALRHLMHRKFTDKESMSDAAFYEMVDSVIQNDLSLAEEAIYYLRNEGEIVGAAKCALRHAVPYNNVAYEIQQEMAKINPRIVPTPAPKQTLQSWDEDWDVPSPQQQESKHSAPAAPAPAKSTSPIPKPAESKKLRPDDDNIVVVLPSMFDIANHVDPIDRTTETVDDAPAHYVSRLPVTSIQILDTGEGVDIFLQHLKAAQMAQSGTDRMSGSRIVVGFDCEWKPMMSEQPGVALIQVATAEDIFLIDTCKLRAGPSFKPMTDRFESLLKNFFANERILKIGYGLQSDMKMLSRSVPAWTNIQSDFKCILDLATLSKELLKLNPDFYPFPGSGTGSGLSELVRCCTSLSLNKEDQFSDWEKRPLRESQIIYAATDAYCLLDIFEMMKRRALDLGIHFEDLVQKFINNNNAQTQVKPDRKKLSRTEIITSASQSVSILPPESPFVSPRSVGDVKLVCDNMLQGLGKQLRCCGIDTLILSNMDSHARAAHYALQDDRCIVTSGKIYQQLSSYVPIGHCFSVSAESLVDQLREVLTYFNVVITNSDIHSRCQCCNSNSFHKVPGLVMKEMVWLYGHHRSHDKDFRKTESGSLEVEDDVVPSSSPLVNVMTPHQDTRGWKILPETDLIADATNRLLRTPTGASVGLSSIPGPVLDFMDYFYVCTGCGKCYWIGSHYRRILEGKGKVPPGTVQNVNSQNDAANQNI